MLSAPASAATWPLPKLLRDTAPRPDPHPRERRAALVANSPAAAAGSWTRPYVREMSREGRRTVAARAAGGGGEEEAGLGEAFELLAEAQRMAEEQTRAELMQMQLDDAVHSGPVEGGGTAESADGGGGGLPDTLRFGSEAVYPLAVKALQKTLLAQGFAPADESGRFGLGTEAALKEFQASRSLPLSGVVDKATLDELVRFDRQQLQDTRVHATRLQHFWREEGLANEAAIAQLVEQLTRDGAEPSMDALYARLQRLRRLLPEADVLKIATSEPQVLKMDLGQATSNLVLLTQAMPSMEVAAVIEAFPRVLLMEDLKRRLEVCIERLAFWSPRSIASQVLADNPSFLHRIPEYYSAADSFSSLPVDIQNSMAIGGGGGGFAFRSWSGFVDNNTD
eukprot:jgi/Tetstr1/421986/TSEL_001231.t2